MDSYFIQFSCYKKEELYKEELYKKKIKKYIKEEFNKLYKFTKFPSVSNLDAIPKWLKLTF